MRKKVIIFVLAAAVLLFFIFSVIYRDANKAGINETKLGKTKLNETKFVQTEFVSEISFTLIESKMQDNQQSFILSIENGSNYEIMYGEFYVLEMWMDGKWYEIYQPGAWYDLGCTLKAGCCAEVKIVINGQLDLKEGTYRIIKDILFTEDIGTCGREGYIAANFEVY